MLISRLTNDVQALDQLVTEGMQTLFSSTLTLHRHHGDPRGARPGARARHLPDLPAAPDRQRDLPARLLGRLPAHTRADRARDRLPPGDALGRARRARLRPGAPPHDALRRAERRAPRGEHADRLPERRLLPGGRAAVGRGHGGDPDLRRQPGDRRRGVDRRARLVRLLPPELLRPDPVALAALHDLPGRHGGARQDLRAARRGAGHRATARTRSSCRGCAARSSSTT